MLEDLEGSRELVENFDLARKAQPHAGRPVLESEDATASFFKAERERRADVWFVLKPKSPSTRTS